MGRERLWWGLQPLCVTPQYHLASWLPGFPPLAFPTTVSSLTSPGSISPQSTAAMGLPWDCPTIPKLQLPAAAASRGPASVSGVCMAAVRTVWFSFHLGCHRSPVSVSALNVSPLTQTIAAMWGSDPCFSSPTPGGRSSPTHTPAFPPSSFVLPSFTWVYIFFSSGQMLLSALSWCSACTLMSEGVFLMYPWREMYSTSTYFFAIFNNPKYLSNFWLIVGFCLIVTKSIKYQGDNSSISALVRSANSVTSVLPN